MQRPVLLHLNWSSLQPGHPCSSEVSLCRQVSRGGRAGGLPAVHHPVTPLPRRHTEPSGGAVEAGAGTVPPAQCVMGETGAAHSSEPSAHSGFQLHLTALHSKM